MFDAYFKAVLARNRNQQLVADLFSRHLDFGADFLQHQIRVFAIVSQWRNPGGDSDPGTADGAAAEPEKPRLKIVQTRR